MTIVNDIRNHGWIPWVFYLNKVKATLLWTAVKMIQMKIAAVNYIKQYQLNFG